MMRSWHVFWQVSFHDFANWTCESVCKYIRIYIYTLISYHTLSYSIWISHRRDPLWTTLCIHPFGTVWPPNWSCWISNIDMLWFQMQIDQWIKMRTNSFIHFSLGTLIQSTVCFICHEFAHRDSHTTGPPSEYSILKASDGLSVANGRVGTDFQIARRDPWFGNTSKGFNMVVHCIDLDAKT